MTKSLVTGAAGFIGSHLSKFLLNSGHEVVALDDLSGGFEDNLPSGVEFINGSTVDKDLVHKIFAENKIDYVFHLAAYAAEGLSHFIRHFNYTNNVLGSVNLINEAIRNEIKRFVFTSSIAVYGSNQLPMHEGLIPQPEDPYGIAKYAIEMDLRVAHEMFGLDYTVFRPHNVYGEHQNIADKYRNVVGIFMNQIMKGEPLTIFGDGKQTRAFSHIDEVVPVIGRSIEVEKASCEVFNVGADRPFSVNELAETVCKAMGVESEIIYLPPRNEVTDAYASHEKAERILGAVSSVPLEIGLQRMADWARSKGPRSTPAFEGVEIEKCLPESWQTVVSG
jgi:UDP-glucose 4-epimerase